MKAFPQGRAASAAALLVALGAAPAAQAAVTAQQVWDDWKAQVEASGQMTLTTGGESYAGGVLTVTDLALDGTDGSDGTVNVAIAQMTFTEGSDGSVTVTLPEEIPVVVRDAGDEALGEAPSDVTLLVKQTGASLTVTGDPGALTYDLAATRSAIELDSVMQDGVEVPAEVMVALNDLSGTMTSTTGAMREVAYDLAAASMDLLVDVTSAEDGSTLTFSGQVSDLGIAAEGSLPLTPPADPAAYLASGVDIAGGYSFGGASYIFEFADAAGPTSGTLATQAGEVTFDVSAASMAYDASVTGMALDATSAQMPFPVSVSLAEYGVNVLIPAQKSDTPQDWAVGVNLTDLSVNEEIWGMLDPGGMLDHGPATLILDLTGTATVLFDLFDPAQQEAMAAAPMPGTVDSVSINDLNVAVGGAQVTGTGAFTLDNADMTTFPGMPKPTGSAEFTMTGVNGLIDDLVAMGLLPQEQVMGARMFLGLLAVPVAGQEDTLTSRIEVTADGQLLANGQRLQ